MPDRSTSTSSHRNTHQGTYGPLPSPLLSLSPTRSDCGTVRRLSTKLNSFLPLQVKFWPWLKHGCQQTTLLLLQPTLPTSLSLTPLIQRGGMGGTGLLISNTWKFTPLSSCNYISLEYHEISVTKAKLHLVIIYCTPSWHASDSSWWLQHPPRQSPFTVTSTLSPTCFSSVVSSLLNPSPIHFSSLDISKATDTLLVLFLCMVRDGTACLNSTT